MTLFITRGMLAIAVLAMMGALAYLDNAKDAAFLLWGAAFLIAIMMLPEVK